MVTWRSLLVSRGIKIQWKRLGIADDWEASQELDPDMFFHVQRHIHIEYDHNY